MKLNEMKNDLDAKCAYLRDEKIDIIIRMDFYRKVLVHIMNENNYKKVALILNQINIIYSNLLFECDTEHLIYRKVLKLLEKNGLSKEELNQIKTLLANLDDIYLYRSSYDKEYSIFLKNSVDNPEYIFEQYCPVLERGEILDYLDCMIAR